MTKADNDSAGNPTPATAAMTALRLLAGMPMALQIHDGTGTVVEVNHRWEELWGVPGAMATGRFNILADPQFRIHGVETFFSRAAAGETVHFPEMEFNPMAAGLGGRRRWIRTTFFPVVTETAGRLVAAAFQDITGCMQCEERYNLLVDNANEAIMVVQDGILKFFNPKALAICGYVDQSDYAGKAIAQFVHPDHREFILERHRLRVAGETVPTFYELKVLHKAGHTRWLSMNAVRIDWEGRPASLAFLFDITAQKEAEEALRRHQEELEELVRERTAALEEALAKVKTLRGLLPICAHCKKIRDDQGYWKHIEDYISQHSEAEFSHGLCPHCARTHYPFLFEDEELKGE